jgi:hypothetical protein
LDGPRENLAILLFVARQPTLAVLLLVVMVASSIGVVNVSMGIFDYGYLVMKAFSQTRHNTLWNWAVTASCDMTFNSLLNFRATESVVVKKV